MLQLAVPHEVQRPEGHVERTYFWDTQFMGFVVQFAFNLDGLV